MTFGDGADVTLSVEGRVARRVRAIDEYARPLRRRVLLIHGYNTSELKSGVSMRDFRRVMSECHAPLAREIFTATWPGKGPTKALEYPWTIKYARSTAVTLACDLRRRYREPGDGELVLIAHSLGCRVVLETLNRLARSGRPAGLRQLTVILMAPAVPVYMVREGGSLAAALSIVDRFHVLHSRRDWILWGAFRLGQTVAREGHFPEAIGTDGNPFDRERQNMHPAGHNSYWPSRAAAIAACRAIGVPVAATALVQPATLTPELPMAAEISSPLLPLH